MNAPQDLTDSEIGEINVRLRRALGKYYAMPFHSLLYRIGEVGAQRVDERKLRRAIAELADNGRPRRGKTDRGPHEPAPSIYVSADTEKAEVETKGSAALDDLRELATYVNETTSDDVATRLAATLPGSRVTALDGQNREIPLAGDVTLSASVSQIDVLPDEARSRVSILVMHEPDWLYPDDPRLWRFFVACAETDTQPVVVARAIAPGTFPLFKATGAIGLQYYSTLVHTERLVRAETIRDEIGWNHIRSSEGLKGHLVLDQLQNAVERLATASPVADTQAAIRLARTFGLHENPTIPSVIRWWHESNLNLPAPVVQGWLRWEVWSAYRRGRSTRPNAIVVQLSQGVSKQDTDHGQGQEQQQQEVVPVADNGVQSPAPEVEPTQRTGFGRETQVIPLGLPLPWREVQRILASTKRGRESDREPE